jgi:hypothetical protein
VLVAWERGRESERAMKSKRGLACLLILYLPPPARRPPPPPAAPQDVTDAVLYAAFAQLPGCS